MTDPWIDEWFVGRDLVLRLDEKEFIQTSVYIYISLSLEITKLFLPTRSLPSPIPTYLNTCANDRSEWPFCGTVIIIEISIIEIDVHTFRPSN